MGFSNDGISAYGNEQGGFFQDDNSTGRAHVAWGDKGIEAWGSTMGGYFKDRDSSPRAEAKLAYTKEGTAARYGVWAQGTVAGGLFKDSDGGDGEAILAAGNMGVDAEGSKTGVKGEATSSSGEGGVFSNSAGGTALWAMGETAIGSGSPETLLDVRGEGSVTGGVTGFDEVVARFRQTQAGKHSGIAIDALTGQDPIVYFSENGQAIWDLRVNVDEFGAGNTGVLEARVHHSNNPGGWRIWQSRLNDVETGRAQIGFYGPVLSFPDGAHSLGSQTNRWKDVWATNPIIQTSDQRLKDQVTELGYGLPEVLRLRPVSYVWKASEDRRTHLGLIAQEVEPLIPEAVRRGQDPEETWAMTYASLIPVLVRAIQEQHEVVETLSTRVVALEDGRK